MISRWSSPIPEIRVWPGLLVGAHAEGRILVGQPLQARRQLVLVALRLRLDRDRDDGLGKVHRLERDRSGLDGERLAGRRVLQADDRGDLAGADLLPLLAVVRVHLQDAADPLGAAASGVQHALAGLHLARVDADVGQLPHVRVGHDLEGECRKRLVERRAARELVLGARVEAVHGRDVERARQVLDNGVEQRLDAFVLEGGAEQHRRHLGVERRCAQRAPDHLGRHRILVLEVGLEELLVLLRDRVDQLVVVLARLFAELLRNLVLVDVHAERVVVREGTHLDQVDDPAEALLRPIGS